MKIINKYVEVEITQDSEVVEIFFPETGTPVQVSRDEAYELWASLDQIFGE